MDLLTLLLLSAVLATGSCSPLVPPGAPGHAAHDAERSEPFHLAIPATTGASTVNDEPSSTPTPPPTAQWGASQGDPMKPILGRREALNLAPDLSPLDTVALQPLPAKGCTTTLSETYGYPCSWDGTTTMYASTTIMFQQVNCNGCENVYVYKDMYYCPNQRINATQWREAPSTSWSTICRPSAALRQRTEQDVPAITTPSDSGAQQAAGGVIPAATALPTPKAEFGAKGARGPQIDVQSAACPTTLVVQPQRSAGKTATSYSTITTSTVSVDCGGCPLVISTALAGYGPPGSFVTTTTLPVGAVTTYGCR